MSARVDLDAVARELGVTTDDAIVDAVTELRATLGFYGEELHKTLARLEGSLEGAGACVLRAVTALEDAHDEFAGVIEAASEHRRGDW